MTNEMQTKKWPNINYLKGIRCPKCGSYEPFFITFEAMYTVFDDGIQGQSNHDWRMDSDIECPACGHTGIVSEFQQNRTAGEIMHLEGEEGKEGRATYTDLTRDFGMRTSAGNDDVALFVYRALEAIKRGRVGNSSWLATVNTTIEMIHGQHPEVTSVTVRDHIFNALAPAYSQRYKVSLPYDAIRAEAQS